MRRSFIIGILLSVSTVAFSQKGSGSLKGVILDSESKEPLGYAHVVIQRTFLGTVADSTGHFSLPMQTVLPGDTILFSFVGYTPVKKVARELSNEQPLEIMLSPDPQQLEEFTLLSKEKGFKLKRVVKEAVRLYNEKVRKAPHAAYASFSETGMIDGELLLQEQSVGYAVYGGHLKRSIALVDTTGNQGRLSESEPSVFINNIASQSSRDKLVLNGGTTLLHHFRAFENYGVLSNKNYNAFTYALKDRVKEPGKPEYALISFENKKDGTYGTGEMRINLDDNSIQTISYYGMGLYGAERVLQYTTYRFEYYGYQPFLSEISNSYERKTLEYTNNMRVLLQKFDDFELSNEETEFVQGQQIMGHWSLLEGALETGRRSVRKKPVLRKNLPTGLASLYEKISIIF